MNSFTDLEKFSRSGAELRTPNIFSIFCKHIAIRLRPSIVLERKALVVTAGLDGNLGVATAVVSLV